MRSISKKQVAGRWDAPPAAGSVHLGAVLRLSPAMRTPDRPSGTRMRLPARHAAAGHGAAQTAAGS
jgi:hypothetical protein